VNYQIVSRAVVVATGITEDGGREVLGLMVGDSESEAFRKEFLRSLRERGLSGVRLVVTDQHAGLLADAEELCHLGDLPAGGDQIKDTAGGTRADSCGA